MSAVIQAQQVVKHSSTQPAKLLCLISGDWTHSIWGHATHIIMGNSCCEVIWWPPTPLCLFALYLVHPVDLLHVREVNLWVKADGCEDTSQLSTDWMQKKKDKRRQNDGHSLNKLDGSTLKPMSCPSLRLPMAVAINGLASCLCAAQLWSVRVCESFSHSHKHTQSRSPSPQHEQAHSFNLGEVTRVYKAKGE